MQREMLAKYHVDDPREFFTNNAFWSVPSDPTIDTSATAAARTTSWWAIRQTAQTVVPAGQRDGRVQPGIPVRLHLGALRSRELRQDHGAAVADRHPDPGSAADPELDDLRHPGRSERTLLERSNRIQYGNLLTLPIADGGVLYVEPLYTERISTAPEQVDVPAAVAGAGELPRTRRHRRRPRRIRPHPRRGPRPGVRRRHRSCRDRTRR